MYSANLNPSNPIGTVRSIEHTLRSLDKLAAEQQNRVARAEKELVDYQAQADRPFEHEDRLKQLLSRQSELNSLLDLDKGDQQGAESASEINEGLEKRKAELEARPNSEEVAKMAEEFMRASGTAILELPIIQRTPPEAGSVTGRAVAMDKSHVAVATAADRFIVVESATPRRGASRRAIIVEFLPRTSINRQRPQSRKMTRPETSVNLTMPQGLGLESRTVWIMRSRDDGATWSNPVNITASVKRPERTWYATGPVTAFNSRADALSSRAIMLLPGPASK